VRFLVNHLAQLFSELATNEQWISSGFLGKHHISIVGIFATFLRRNDFLMSCHVEELFSKYVTVLQAWNGNFDLDIASRVVSVLRSYRFYAPHCRGFVDMRDIGLLAQGLRAFGSTRYLRCAWADPVFQDSSTRRGLCRFDICTGDTDWRHVGDGAGCQR